MKKLGSSVYAAHDLVADGLVSQEEIERAIQITEQYAGRTVLTGDSSTSLGLIEGAETSEVFVLTGDQVQSHLPWLDALYRNELTAFVSSFAGRTMYPSQNLRSGVNINLLKGKGAHYEWHCDSNPVTGLIFLNSLSEGEGGELVFRTDAEELTVRPRAGVFLAFDAREIPHCVLPLRNEKGDRFSVPMNFYLTADAQERPDDLDEYLFKFTEEETSCNDGQERNSSKRIKS